MTTVRLWSICFWAGEVISFGVRLQEKQCVSVGAIVWVIFVTVVCCCVGVTVCALFCGCSSLEDIAVHPTCLLSLIGLFVRTSNDFVMVSGERNIIPESTPASSFFITSPVSALRTQKDN